MSKLGENTLCRQNYAWPDNQLNARQQPYPLAGSCLTSTRVLARYKYMQFGREIQQLVRGCLASIQGALTESIGQGSNDVSSRTSLQHATESFNGH